MKAKLTLITASNGVSLTKSFSLNPNYTVNVANSTGKSKLVKTPYPIVKEVNSREIELDSPKDLFDFINIAAKNGSAMMAGVPSEPIVNESRAGKISNTQETWLLTIDIDGRVGIHIDSPKGVQLWLDKTIPEISQCDYSLQFSSSNQFADKTTLSSPSPSPTSPHNLHNLGIEVKFHAEFVLQPDKPLTPMVKQNFIKQINERAKLITELNRHDSCISWAIDPVPNRNTQLIFISPPNVDKNVPLSLYNPNLQQIFFIKGKNQYVNSDLITQISKQWDPEIEKAHIQRIRKEKGLPDKTLTYKTTADNTEYLTNPDAVTIKPIKTTGDYVICNLNDGDSGGYWHSLSRPYFMYNFKDEPIFKLEDANADYFKECQKKVPVDLPAFFAFNDINTDKTFTKDGESGYTERRSAQKLASWYKTVGIPNEETQKIGQLDMMDFSFDPTKPPQDVHAEPFIFLNKYVEPSYLRDPKDNRYPRIGQFPYLKEAILNMCGGSVHDYNRFLNWLAFVVQTKRMTQTSWVFRGVQGTGKGITHTAIQQMFGAEYIAMPTEQTFKDKFTSWAAESIFVIANEAKIGAKDMDFVKTLITDKTVSKRAMGVDAQTSKNWCNVLLFTNKVLPVSLDPQEEDRRFNITPFQHIKLSTIAKYPGDTVLEREIAHLQYYLQSHNVNVDDVHTPEMSEAKKELMEQSAHAIRDFTNALEQGDLYFFAQELQSPIMTDGQRGPLRKQYEGIIRRLISDTVNQPKRLHFLHKNEVVNMYQYIMDAHKDRPAAILKHIAHQSLKLQMKKVRPSVDPTRRMGLEIEFTLSTEEEKYIQMAQVHYLNNQTGT